MISRNSRLQLTTAVQVVDQYTGEPTQPAFMDLRQRVTATDPSDRFVQATDADSWGTIGLNQLLDARAWWVVADLSDVIDPFTELETGHRYRAPSAARYLFQILGDVE